MSPVGDAASHRRGPQATREATDAERRRESQTEVSALKTRKAIAMETWKRYSQAERGTPDDEGTFPADVGRSAALRAGERIGGR